MSETRGDTTLPSYFGDNVNGAAFDAATRHPDPQRLIKGYERAALTMNFIRSLVGGGFADLHHPEFWNLGFVRHARGPANTRRWSSESVNPYGSWNH